MLGAYSVSGIDFGVSLFTQRREANILLYRRRCTRKFECRARTGRRPSHWLCTHPKSITGSGIESRWTKGSEQSMRDYALEFGRCTITRVHDCIRLVQLLAWSRTQSCGFMWIAVKALGACDACLEVRQLELKVRDCSYLHSELAIPRECYLNGD